MTIPDTDDAENASRAHDFLHALLTPLIPHDPTGIAIKAQASEVLLLASARNMGAIIGKGGSMVEALRQLMRPFGWRLQVPSHARHDLHTPPLDSAPDVRTLVLGWLDARYGPEAYKLAGEPESLLWEIFVHPNHYDHADHSALETWAYNASRAQGQRLKIRLKPGGLIKER
jgi:predicted RNA-binding protein YlqC (UPF0109 family)